MNEPKLKPCPFCGGEAAMWKHEQVSYTEYRACCLKCHVTQAGMYYFSEKEAIESWNRRADNEQRDQTN